MVWVILGAQANPPASSPLKKPPGEGTGRTTYADSRGFVVGRVPSRGEPDVFERAATPALAAASESMGVNDPTAVSFSMAARHWSFKPPRERPVPVVKNTQWPLTAVDASVLAGLEQAGLSPSPPADKRTLIRRATYDLTGLPPTPAEIDAFVRDGAPVAFARMVDRLL